MNSWLTSNTYRHTDKDTDKHTNTSAPFRQNLKILLLAQMAEAWQNHIRTAFIAQHIKETVTRLFLGVRVRHKSIISRLLRRNLTGTFHVCRPVHHRATIRHRSSLCS